MPLLASALLAACGGSRGGDPPREDGEAMALLEGIWVDASEDDVSFLVRGDTIYYPDSISRPVGFRIESDTLVLLGTNVSKYGITRQGPDVFEFDNGSGDTARFVRSENPDDSLFFTNRQVGVVSGNDLERTDTVVSHGGTKYHSYVDLRRTRDRVYKTTINDDGLEVERLYYDNVVHLSIQSAKGTLFVGDFSKADFASFVPEYMLSQSVLGGIVLSGIDDEGIHYAAMMSIPDSQSSFVVGFVISYKGELAYAGDN